MVMVPEFIINEFSLIYKKYKNKFPRQEKLVGGNFVHNLFMNNVRPDLLKFLDVPATIRAGIRFQWLKQPSATITTLLTAPRAMINPWMVWIKSHPYKAIWANQRPANLALDGISYLHMRCFFTTYATGFFDWHKRLPPKMMCFVWIFCRCIASKDICIITHYVE